MHFLFSKQKLHKCQICQAIAAMISIITIIPLVINVCVCECLCFLPQWLHTVLTRCEMQRDLFISISLFKPPCLKIGMTPAHRLGLFVGREGVK